MTSLRETFTEAPFSLSQSSGGGFPSQWILSDEAPWLPVHSCIPGPPPAPRHLTGCSVYICPRTKLGHNEPAALWKDGLCLPQWHLIAAVKESTVNCNPSLSLFFGKGLQTTVTSPIKCHNSCRKHQPMPGNEAARKYCKMLVVLSFYGGRFSLLHSTFLLFCHPHPGFYFKMKERQWGLHHISKLGVWSSLPEFSYMIPETCLWVLSIVGI